MGTTDVITRQYYRRRIHCFTIPQLSAPAVMFRGPDVGPRVLSVCPPPQRSTWPETWCPCNSTRTLPGTRSWSANSKPNVWSRGRSVAWLHIVSPFRSLQRMLTRRRILTNGELPQPNLDSAVTVTLPTSNLRDLLTALPNHPPPLIKPSQPTPPAHHQPGLLAPGTTTSRYCVRGVFILASTSPQELISP